MAFTVDGVISVGGNASASAGSTLGLSVSGANITVGKLAVIAIAKDNVGTTDAQTSEVSSITDNSGGGNTWVKAGEFCNGNAAANAGAVVSVWYSLITSQITAGAGAITVNFSSSITAKAGLGICFNIAAGNTVGVASGSLQTLANDAADPGSMSISGLTSKEYLFVRAVAAESSTTTNISGTNYTAVSATGATSASGGSAANQGARMLYRILTGTGDTLDPTLFSADHASVYFALEEVSSGPAPGTPQIIATAVQRAAYH